MKLSPVDQDDSEELDEFFGTDVGVNTLPEDEDIEFDQLSAEDRARLPEMIADEVKARNGHPRLASIVVSFEYQDREGGSNWVNLSYHLREFPEDYNDVV